MYNFLNYLAFA